MSYYEISHSPHFELSGMRMTEAKADPALMGANQHRPVGDVRNQRNHAPIPKPTIVVSAAPSSGEFGKKLSLPIPPGRLAPPPGGLNALLTEDWGTSRS
jgi:hypothetical protein